MMKKDVIGLRQQYLPFALAASALGGIALFLPLVSLDWRERLRPFSSFRSTLGCQRAQQRTCTADCCSSCCAVSGFGRGQLRAAQ